MKKIKNLGRNIFFFKTRKININIESEVFVKRNIEIYL